MFSFGAQTNSSKRLALPGFEPGSSGITTAYANHYTIEPTCAFVSAFWKL